MTELSALRSFELEVCPHQFRLAIIPGQPMLFGHTPERGSRGAIYLVSQSEHSSVLGVLKQNLEDAIDSGGVLSLPCAEPERAFAEGFMATPSVHLRVERGDNRAQVYFDLAACPPQLIAFCERARALATDLVASLPARQVAGADALRLVRPGVSWRDLVIAVLLLIVLVVIGWLGM